mmetsp:Transcript_10149/g.17792  ORF Transcript_10149/g.17792 Transcript_10149/m.17792 type:complete len:135 (+) Transcript_10149:39-443(+)
MMNYSALLLPLCVVIVGPLSTLTTAFSPTTTAHHNHALVTPTKPTSTTLHSIIFEPPPEENCEIDGSDCEESIFDRKRREKGEADNAIKERYRTEHGVELTDVDMMESIDQYANAETGGNLIAGVSLSALMEDD